MERLNLEPQTTIIRDTRAAGLFGEEVIEIE